MMTDTSLDCLEAVVHQSILQPILVWKAPYKPAMLNIFVLLAMLAQFRAWMWCVLSAGIHLSLRFAAAYDQFCVEMLQGAFKHRWYYGV